jgi:hypothetical protein
MNSKRLSVITFALVLCMAAFGQTGSVSAAIEPALKSPAQFGVSFTGALNISRDNYLTALYGYSDVSKPAHAGLLGVGRNLVEFMPGFTLAGNVQVGAVFSGGTVRRALVFGTGVVTDLGNGYTVTYGLHVNKVRDSKLYPSAYVSLGYSFGRYR